MGKETSQQSGLQASLAQEEQAWVQVLSAIHMHMRNAHSTAYNSALFEDGVPNTLKVSSWIGLSCGQGC